jgi:hypothetical protein
MLDRTSSGVRALTKFNSIDSEGAAALSSSITFGYTACITFGYTAYLASTGRRPARLGEWASFSSCSRLVLRSVVMSESAVTFPQDERGL